MTFTMSTAVDRDVGAVKQRKQSVACEDDDEELARELAEEEEEGGDDASDAGYERDGFVVGDNDV